MINNRTIAITPEGADVGQSNTTKNNTQHNNTNFKRGRRIHTLSATTFLCHVINVITWQRSVIKGDTLLCLFNHGVVKRSVIVLIVDLDLILLNLVYCIHENSGASLVCFLDINFFVLFCFISFNAFHSLRDKFCLGLVIFISARFIFTCSKKFSSATYF